MYTKADRSQLGLVYNVKIESGSDKTKTKHVQQNKSEE